MAQEIRKKLHNFKFTIIDSKILLIVITSWHIQVFITMQLYYGLFYIHMAHCNKLGNKLYTYTYKTYHKYFP